MKQQMASERRGDKVSIDGSPSFLWSLSQTRTHTHTCLHTERERDRHELTTSRWAHFLPTSPPEPLEGTIQVTTMTCIMKKTNDRISNHVDNDARELRLTKQASNQPMETMVTYHSLGTKRRDF